MATATLGSVPTVIDNAEAVTNWGGDTFALEPDIKVQGNNSVACAQTTNGNNDVYVTGTWDFSGTGLGDQHLRLWVNLSYIAYFSATNPIQVFLYDGTNTAYYYWDKGASYSGGWEQIVVYTGDTPDSGTVTKSTITRIGVRVVTSSKPRNVTNAWYDAWTYGDGYYATGGSASDPITLADIAAADVTSAYNIVEEVEGVYFLRGDIQLGNGATATYFESEGAIAVFTEEQVNTGLYKLSGAGSGCDVVITDTVIKSAGSAAKDKFIFDMDDGDLNSFTMSGSSLFDGGLVYFKAGQSITSCVFNGMDMVDPSTATFTGNKFANYAGSDGAMLLDADGAGNMEDLTFDSLGTGHGIYMSGVPSDGEHDFDNFRFTGYGSTGTTNAAVNNDTGEAVTINVTGGGLVSETTYYNNASGSSTTVSASFTHTLINIVEGSEVTYVETNSAQTVLHHVESVGSDGESAYVHSGGEEVDILIFHVDYLPEVSNIIGLTLPSADVTVQIAQFDDPNYDNP